MLGYFRRQGVMILFKGAGETGDAASIKGQVSPTMVLSSLIVLIVILIAAF